MESFVNFGKNLNKKAKFTEKTGIRISTELLKTAENENNQFRINYLLPYGYNEFVPADYQV